ncbi:hypothetical protein JL720_2306 [Aureococcus anophagefferens]|nr:hypothetical protein JL720_2306 [Aureococcus anophagefferens]
MQAARVLPPVTITVPRKRRPSLGPLTSQKLLQEPSLLDDGAASVLAERVRHFVPRCVLRRVVDCGPIDAAEIVRLQGAVGFSTSRASRSSAAISRAERDAPRQLQGEGRVATALSASHAEGAELLTTQLNGMFTGVLGVIRKHGGDVIKFVGDAMIVLWAPPLPRAAPAKGGSSRFAVKWGSAPAPLAAEELDALARVACAPNATRRRSTATAKPDAATNERRDVAFLKAIQRALLGVQAAAAAHGAILRQFVRDDKGFVAVLAAGLPSKHAADHGDPSCVALGICQDFRKRVPVVSRATRVGVTVGDCFCGPVGATPEAAAAAGTVARRMHGEGAVGILGAEEDKRASRRERRRSWKLEEQPWIDDAAPLEPRVAPRGAAAAPPPPRRRWPSSSSPRSSSSATSPSWSSCWSGAREPFVALELLHELLERRVAAVDGATGELRLSGDASGAVGVPAAVAAAVSGAFDTLDSACQAALRLAAALGHRADVACLAYLFDYFFPEDADVREREQRSALTFEASRSSFGDVSRELLRLKYVVADGNDVVFVSDLARSVLYHQMVTADRRKVHRQIVCWQTFRLVKNESSPGLEGDVAFHALCSDQPLLAFHFCVLAFGDAVRDGRVDVALGFCDDCALISENHALPAALCAFAQIGLMRARASDYAPPACAWTCFAPASPAVRRRRRHGDLARARARAVALPSAAPRRASDDAALEAFTAGVAGPGLSARRLGRAADALRRSLERAIARTATAGLRRAFAPLVAPAR